MNSHTTLWLSGTGLLCMAGAMTSRYRSPSVTVNSGFVSGHDFPLMVQIRVSIAVHHPRIFVFKDVAMIHQGMLASCRLRELDQQLGFAFHQDCVPASRT